MVSNFVIVTLLLTLPSACLSFHPMSVSRIARSSSSPLRFHNKDNSDLPLRKSDMHSTTAAGRPKLIIEKMFREETDPTVELPEFVVKTNKFAIGFVKDILGVIYGDRHYARFAALETIARVPYFSCKS